MDDKKKKGINWVVALISILLVVFLPFVFDLKITDSGTEFRGFPFDWLAIYPNNGYSFKGMGFLANIVIFYWLLNLVTKRARKKRELS